jgi:hypothetical protein
MEFAVDSEGVTTSVSMMRYSRIPNWINLGASDQGATATARSKRSRPDEGDEGAKMPQWLSSKLGVFGTRTIKGGK